MGNDEYIKSEKYGFSKTFNDKGGSPVFLIEPICFHVFKKTEPSELDEHCILLWQCVKCGYKTSST